MGVIQNFFKGPKPLLTESDNAQLKEIQRESYMEEAKKIMAERGKELARKDLMLKKPKDDF